jgi:ACS family D-galactonate transporter-like MFS transporter
MHIPKLRWRIGILLGVGVLINYFDRINLSVAAPQLQQGFGLSNHQMGWLFSSFFWPYALAQIPIGMVLDRFGVTRVSRVSTLLWSVASAASAVAGGLGGMLGSRILLGIAEAPSFPANAKATGYWFPRRERALATAIFDAAAKLSNVVGVPLVALAVAHLGWRWGFGITALLSLLYFLVFVTVYRDPSQHRSLTPEEHEYIRSGGATTEGPAQGGEVAMLGYLLRNRKVWGLSIGFSAYGYSFYLLLTWLPSYLVQAMHMDILRSAGFAAIPWIFATIADLMVGG